MSSSAGRWCTGSCSQEVRHAAASSITQPPGAQIRMRRGINCWHRQPRSVPRKVFQGAGRTFGHGIGLLGARAEQWLGSDLEVLPSLEAVATERAVQIRCPSSTLRSGLTHLRVQTGGSALLPRSALSHEAYYAQDRYTGMHCVSSSLLFRRDQRVPAAAECSRVQT
jgi:hypothetical protein